MSKMQGESSKLHGSPWMTARHGRGAGGWAPLHLARLLCVLLIEAVLATDLKMTSEF